MQSRTRNNLYRRVISCKWLRDNPQRVRKSALKLGISLTVAGLVDSLLVGAAAGWGLVLLSVVLFGIGLIFLVHRSGARTVQGFAVLAQARGFELYLRTAEKKQLRFEEGIDIFSRYPPYTMIFGTVDRWMKLFAKLGNEGSYQVDTSWYQGMDLYHPTGIFYTNLSSFSCDFSCSLLYATLTEKAAQMAQSAQPSPSGSSSDSGFSGDGGFSGGGSSGDFW